MGRTHRLPEIQRSFAAATNRFWNYEISWPLLSHRQAWLAFPFMAGTRHRLSGPHAANIGLSEFQLQPLCRSRCGFKARGGFAELAIKIDVAAAPMTHMILRTEARKTEAASTSLSCISNLMKARALCLMDASAQARLTEGAVSATSLVSRIGAMSARRARSTVRLVFRNPPGMKRFKAIRCRQMNSPSLVDCSR